jgi:hypothetical protein
MKNLCAKTRKPEEAYVVYSDGEWTYFVLKKYQTPEKEEQNIYARWYCLTTSPMTPKGEYGDAYVSTVLQGTCEIPNPLVPTSGDHDEEAELDDEDDGSFTVLIIG